ncbi:MAG: GNAT family N-acetyltransferase [Chthoniobacter sp.]|uniref:GNAT family N-acetyltransferase n=1 Tax=Chthoniobacter sp. TaxID=2510640 RepID=UPI0032A7D18D
MLPPIFESAGYYGRELIAAEVPRVQALFDAHPAYFLATNGRRAKPDEAQVEFADFPPAHLTFTQRWFAGLFNRDDELIGVAVVVSDLCAAQVWHIALFLVATHLHGRGVGSEIFVALEAWMRASGAKWLRLGVVEGSARAERFWARHGFQQVRVRAGVETGGRLNHIRVLVKPLGASGVAEYLALVPRDQPDSTLA